MLHVHNHVSLSTTTQKKMHRKCIIASGPILRYSRRTLSFHSSRLAPLKVPSGDAPAVQRTLGHSHVSLVFASLMHPSPPERSGVECTSETIFSDWVVVSVVLCNRPQFLKRVEKKSEAVCNTSGLIRFASGAVLGSE